jgi:hypothetical protein
MQWYGGRIDYRVFYRRTPGSIFLRPSPPDPPHVRKSIKTLNIDWEDFFEKPQLLPPKIEPNYNEPNLDDFIPVKSPEN